MNRNFATSTQATQADYDVGTNYLNAMSSAHDQARKVARIYGGANTPVICPDPRGLTRGKGQKVDSAFSELAKRFALNGITLRRSHWRKGPVIYFVERAGQTRELCNLSDLSLVIWAIGGLHA